MPPYPLSRCVNQASILCRCRQSETGVNGLCQSQVGGAGLFLSILVDRSRERVFTLNRLDSPKDRSERLAPSRDTNGHPSYFFLLRLCQPSHRFRDCTGHDAIWNLVALAAHQACKKRHACGMPLSVAQAWQCKVH
jgi:hypothetical protein